MVSLWSLISDLSGWRLDKEFERRKERSKKETGALQGSVGALEKAEGEDENCWIEEAPDGQRQDPSSNNSSNQRPFLQSR